MDQNNNGNRDGKQGQAVTQQAPSAPIVEQAKPESILDILLIPPSSKGVSKGLLVEAREKAVRKSSNAQRTWHKNCLKDAAIILTAEGNFEAAQHAATEFLKMDNNR